MPELTLLSEYQWVKAKHKDKQVHDTILSLSD